MADVWWPGGKAVGRNLESVQDRVGRKLLEASRTVAGGNLWRVGLK